MVSFRTLVLLLSLTPQLSFAAPHLKSRGADHQPSRTLKHAAGRKTTMVKATPDPNRFEYIAPVQIDGKTYNVMVDTGSTYLWVKGHGTGPAFNYTYYNFDVAGSLTTGKVTIGGITIPKQVYGLASSRFDVDGIDGILGLNLPVPGSGLKTVMENLMPFLKEQRFGVNMEPSTLDTDGISSLTFGYDQSRHQATKPIYFPTVDPALYGWGLNVTSFGVARRSDLTTTCVLDTGSSNITIPQSVAAAYWEQVAGAVTFDNLEWTFPCNSTLPDFTPSISGTRVVIPGKYSTFPNDGKASSTCHSRLGGATDLCSLGQSFLYGQYAIFDYHNQSIGLSPRK